MIQFRGTDWGESFGNGVMKGIAIGNQYRQSKAQYDYENAIEGADAEYEEAIKAAGDDKEKIEAAKKAKDAAYNKAYIKNRAYLGDAKEANQAYTDERESSFLSDNWNPPQAMNVSNLAPSSSFANGEGQAMVASNGPTQGVIPAGQPQQGMPTNANGTVAVTKNPVAQAPAPQRALQQAPASQSSLTMSRGAQGAQADPLAKEKANYAAELTAQIDKDPYLPLSDASKSFNDGYGRIFDNMNIQVGKDGKSLAVSQGGGPSKTMELSPDQLLAVQEKWKQKQINARFPENPTEPARGNGGQTAQPQQGMNLRPEQIMQQQRPAGYMNAREYMVQREMRMAQLEDAFIKRFGRLPTKIDRNKLAEVLASEETLWGNVNREHHNTQALAETSRHNLVSERYKAQEIRAKERANDLKELWYMGKLGGTGKAQEKYDLGEPNEDGSIPILGENKLPTGQALSELRVGNDRVAVYHPDGMAKEMVAKVYKEMTDRYGSAWNKGNQTYWIINKDMPPCSFTDATKLVKSGRYPGMKEVGDKAGSNKKEEPKADKKVTTRINKPIGVNESTTEPAQKRERKSPAQASRPIGVNEVTTEPSQKRERKRPAQSPRPIGYV